MVVKLADTLREETEVENRLISENRFQLAADPTLNYYQPRPKSPVPHINFAPLLNASADLASAAKAFHSALEPIRSGERKLSESRLRELNQLIFRTERRLIDGRGLPRRPWFRHQIYAPGFYTGYGVKTLPGVREAIEERLWEEAKEQIARTSAALSALAGQIRAAATLSMN